MTPPAQGRARDLADQYYTTVDGKLVRRKGMFPMADTTQDRARDLAANLRGWKAGENASDDTVRCIWLVHRAADEIDALLTHGLAERRAGASEMKYAALDHLHQRLPYPTQACAIVSALPLPGDDRE